MCEIDWAALGTWAAVVLALVLAVRERSSRLSFKRQHDSLLASILTPYFIATEITLARLNSAVSRDRSRAYAENLLNSHIPRKSLRDIAKVLDTTLVREMFDRIAGAPSDLSVPILRSVACIEGLRTTIDATLDQGNLDHVILSLEKLREFLAETERQTDAASKACSKHARALH